MKVELTSGPPPTYFDGTEIDSGPLYITSDGRGVAFRKANSIAYIGFSVGTNIDDVENFSCRFRKLQPGEKVTITV